MNAQILDVLSLTACNLLSVFYDSREDVKKASQNLLS